MPAMTDAQRRTFLLEGTRTGTLATVRADGRPHAAPVWFTLDGDDVVFMTGADTVKGRNLARDPRATMVVDEASFPYDLVVLSGTCTLHDDLEVMLTWSRAIAARYVPEDRVEEYARRNAVPGEVLVRLRVEHVVAERAVAH